MFQKSADKTPITLVTGRTTFFNFETFLVRDLLCHKLTILAPDDIGDIWQTTFYNVSFQFDVLVQIQVYFSPKVELTVSSIG